MESLRVLTLAFCALALLGQSVCPAAELTTGSIVGIVQSSAPVPGARIVAHSPSGNYVATTDASGRFVILGVIPDTYSVSAEADGYEPLADVVIVLPGEREQLTFTLRRALKQIAKVEAKGEAFAVGSTSESFTVTGDQARAVVPSESASGLANYTQNTVQGAVAAVPGVQLDSFANVIVRGGKVQDTAFDYDSVPIPQGLIAEPGGNIVGAQLGTTGVESTTVTLSDFSAASQNALGGVVNEIPAVGTYPSRGSVEAGAGIGAYFNDLQIREQWATPDLRWRYALATTQSSGYFPYGDGSSFYPAEIGTYGLALQTRAQSSWAGNVHFQPNAGDDFSASAVSGVTTYSQYDTPYAGEAWSTFNGDTTTFPGQPPNPHSQVNTPSLARGTYFAGKLQWLHTWKHSLGRVYLYRSAIGADANGPYWDDLSFPDGVISIWSQQYQRQDGIGFDFQDQSGPKHDVRAGAQYSVNVSNLNQVVPTANEFITSNPRLNQYLVYLGDTWAFDDHLSVTGTLRYMGQDIRAGALAYALGAIDPHAGLVYAFGDDNALRATFDHTSVAPLPLEVQRSDSAAPAPEVPLAPETADDYSFSYEHGGRTQIRLTYFMEFEKNRIDVLPYNFRTNPENPDAVGVPTNAGMLRSHGVELYAKRGGLTLGANYNRTFTSSVDQFAFNDLNEAAILAGHLYPAGYVPDFTATLSQEWGLLRRHLRVTPLLSYESGYPYGNGTMVWIVNPKTGRPELVPNDNYVNPGYNYYFLKNPALPYAAATNPYVATAGTNEGADPNTLRTTPQTLASLHVEGDLTARLTAIVDVTNLFGVASPTQLQGNPYFIGPPGYTGGNLTYEKAYGATYCKGCLYALGNGVPTNDGMSQIVPWTYGTGAYVPQSYPMARTIQFRLRFQF
jgi:Carboxypeptidase regulatory-like domain